MFNKSKKKLLIIESPSTKSSDSLPSDESKSSSISSSSVLASSDSSETNMMNICNIDLKKEYGKLDCTGENYYSNECNKFLLKKELIERNCLKTEEDENSFLYPNLNDVNFNIKIAEKKEFNDTKYDGTIHKNIKEHADMLAKADFELQPHQAFVKNFLSSQTPYNSLLLYHGLGSGKTCTSIGVCEEMRDYMKQMGINKRIIIVASENVQENFKLQLFDERKLKLVDGIWNIRACTGNKLLQEINPMNMKGITKEKVVSQIKGLINTYYLFLGYGQFANYIIKTMNYEEEIEREKSNKKAKTKDKGKKNVVDVKVVLNKRIINRLRNEFDNRLIVIDEVHNIRKTDDNENKKVAINLELLVRSAENMRFLLLSATPMYNTHREIVWMLNLMNTNDKRGRIEARDLFDKAGNFKKNGEELLIRKATGYISFVRGENPYTFPYRVYPNEFAKTHTFPFIKYPSYQMNLKKIKYQEKKRVLSLYLNKIGDCNLCGECQYCSYKYIIYNLRNKSLTITTKKGVVREMPSFENMESFGYTLLQVPLESLIISYPVEGLRTFLRKNVEDEVYSEELSEDFSEPLNQEEGEEKIDVEDISEEIPKDDEQEKEIKISIPSTEYEDDVLDGGKKSNTNSSASSEEHFVKNIDPHDLTGKKGLERMMNFVDEKSPQEKGSFEYKSTTIKQYGKIFSREIIGKYSSKIKSVLDNIYNKQTGVVSQGVVLIFSQYIDSGLIPMALALEEMGFTRYGDNVKPLFKNRPTDVVDVRTMEKPKDKRDFMPARYAMITGDPRLSPNNVFEVKGLTGEENKDGNRVKVVLISKAGSEGIDFKFIRQVHILEPWYNMNLIEQVIGRAVRNFSHALLPFEKRNVEIFMYGTILGQENKEEAADLYVYRVAEFKAIQIGKVARVLKETAVDCIINHDQTNFTAEKFEEILKRENVTVKQELSTGEVIEDFKIGDKPFSATCDYMATCNYSCRPDKKLDEASLNEDTYNENFIKMNSEKIIQKIRLLMKESFFYKKDVLLHAIRTPKEYPYVQIYSALTQLIEDNNEFIVDKYGRNGRLVNIGEYYLFQPIELKDKNTSIFDRSVPIDYKHSMVNFQINQNIVKPVIDKRNIERIEMEIEKENEAPIISYEIGQKVAADLLANFELTRQFTKEKRVPIGDDNWYKHCGIAMKKMATEFPEMKEYLLEFLVAHLIETLLFEQKLDLMNYLYSLENMTRGTFEWLAKEYFERKSITTKNFNAIIMYNLDKRMIMILNKNNRWVEAEPEDQRELAEAKETKELLAFKVSDYNQIVGFIGYEKSNRYLIFKTKNMESKRDTGARCDEAGKNKTIETINKILGETKYTKENTRIQKEKNVVVKEAIGHTELCVIEEFILRYFDRIRKNDKKWFLSPEMAIYHKLYTVFVK